MAFPVRNTGRSDLDRVQQAIKSAVDAKTVVLHTGQAILNPNVASTFAVRHTGNIDVDRVQYAVRTALTANKPFVPRITGDAELDRIQQAVKVATSR